MYHEPAAPCGPDPAAAYKQRLGVIMCLGYGLFYAGFILINVIRAELMEKQVLFGLNVATVYGFGLIITALILALIYTVLCTRREKALAGGEGVHHG